MDVMLSSGMVMKGALAVSVFESWLSPWFASENPEQDEGVPR
jgi:hypothetical protein